MDDDLFGGVLSERSIPQTDEEWFHLEIQASDIFSPHAPIDDMTLFAGRSRLIDRLIETVFQRGRHAILYGERGVGKTSLANIIKDQIFSKVQGVKIFKRNCTKQHDFRMMWVHAFDDYVIDGNNSDHFLGENPNPYDVYKLLELLPITERPVFIFDEFDRIRHQETYSLMADTIKYFADYSAKATIIIVGVADSIDELFGGHPSIQRNVQQIQMPRMSLKELVQIFEKRLPILGMTMEPRVSDQIIGLSQGLPGYTHLLGQSSAISAIKRRSILMEDFDLKTAIDTCIEQADETIKEGYLKAIRSTKPKNQYKEAFLACALVQTNEKGYFSASDLKAPFSKIMGREMDIPNFARHLSEFCDSRRGPALIRKGKPKSYEYRFVDPLLKPYVLLHGISSNIFDPDN